MKVKIHIKKGDLVKVIAGDIRAKKEKFLECSL
jgi:ribosomal protein L24